MTHPHLADGKCCVIRIYHQSNMTRFNSRKNLAAKSLAAALCLGTAGLSTASAQEVILGPTNSVDSMIEPAQPNVIMIPMKTVVDAIFDTVNGYRMAGIPDGMGAYVPDPINDPETFRLFCNHELIDFQGIKREFGEQGTFVSQWDIDRNSFEVKAGEDLAKEIRVWDPSIGPDGDWRPYVPLDQTNPDSTFSRYCSADLAPFSAFYNSNTGLGTQNRIFTNGEETTTRFPRFQTGELQSGRAMAHVASGPEAGITYELPYLGKTSWENSAACPTEQDLTIVMSMDDSGRSPDLTDLESGAGSQLCVYVGTKKAHGNDVEKAGLTGGKLYGVRVLGQSGNPVTQETNGDVLGGLTTAPFEMVDLSTAVDALIDDPQKFNKPGFVQSGTPFDPDNPGQDDDITNDNGIVQELACQINQVTNWIRLEDGAWDPRNGEEFEGVFYYTTTGDIDEGGHLPFATRVWKLTFADISNPALGGTVELIWTSGFGNGAEQPDEPATLDNMDISADGRLMITEDCGGDDRLCRLWMLNLQTHQDDVPNSVQATIVGFSNPEFFASGGQYFGDRANTNEEHSGVITAESFLGRGWYIVNTQNHLDADDMTPVPAFEEEVEEGGQLTTFYVAPPAISDFDFDGYTDLVFQGDNGQWGFWYLDGPALGAVGGGAWTTTGNWTIRATGDADKDGNADFFGQNLVGQLGVWFMDGENFAAADSLNPSIISPFWRLMASGDFNADEIADLVFQHALSGSIAVAILDDQGNMNFAPLDVVLPEFAVVGTGDFDKDGWIDIVLQHSKGALAVAFMENGEFDHATNLGVQVPWGWEVFGTGDFNTDGKIDLALQRFADVANPFETPDKRKVALWLFDQTQFTGAVTNLPEIDAQWNPVTAN